MTDTPLHVVALGAHPDDIELSMGGLLIRFARAGHRVTWIVATDGAAGGGGQDPDLAARRRAEAQAAATDGGAALEMLCFPDGALAWAPEAPAAIGKRLQALRPSLVVTHATNDYHPDHRALARHVGNVVPMGTPVLRADNMLGLHFDPEFLVDISGVFDTKLAALARHVTQGSLKLADLVDVWNRFRGLQSGHHRFRHAEAYSADRRLGGDPEACLRRIGAYMRP